MEAVENRALRVGLDPRYLPQICESSEHAWALALPRISIGRSGAAGPTSAGQVPGTDSLYPMLLPKRTRAQHIAWRIALIWGWFGVRLGWFAPVRRVPTYAPHLKTLRTICKADKTRWGSQRRRVIHGLRYGLFKRGGRHRCFCGPLHGLTVALQRSASPNFTRLGLALHTLVLLRIAAALTRRSSEVHVGGCE